VTMVSSSPLLLAVKSIRVRSQRTATADRHPPR
jgi:hypothetical protein